MQKTPSTIQLPSPTAWPVVMAFGIALIGTAFVTDIAFAVLGLIFTLAGGIGWFRQVLPHEVHEEVALEQELPEAPATYVETPSATPDRRKILPVETFRITSGIKGGLAGGIAMTIPAAIYSLTRYHSIWYAMNLLAAGGFPNLANASNAFLSEFHLLGFLAALGIHGLTSLLVGLLYGAMLPMFPRYPILTAGFITPVLFTGLLRSVLGIVSPILDQRIDWFWFFISQIAYGLVCGFVVNLDEKVRTPQFQALPFSVRAGLRTDKPEPPQ